MHPDPRAVQHRGVTPDHRRRHQLGQDPDPVVAPRPRRVVHEEEHEHRGQHGEVGGAVAVEEL